MIFDERVLFFGSFGLMPTEGDGTKIVQRHQPSLSQSGLCIPSCACRLLQEAIRDGRRRRVREGGRRRLSLSTADMAQGFLEFRGESTALGQLVGQPTYTP
jgi:hypothetical protein